MRRLLPALALLALQAGFGSASAQPAGSELKDCPVCPVMVVIPPGEFVMGSNEFESEKPPHKVTIAAPLAVGKFEVTFDEWDACFAAGGCKSNPGDQGWGRGKRPVINVTLEDAQEYVTWLSATTGKAYRLLTEAEWEYAARAGTTTAFSTGDTITSDQANFDGEQTYGASPKGMKRGKTIEVGSFKPNAFGLHDMHGNVAEYVQDCYENTYKTAPADGTAMASFPSCPRVTRGSHWNADPKNIRSAARYRNFPGFRHDTTGFRLARAM